MRSAIATFLLIAAAASLGCSGARPHTGPAEAKRGAPELMIQYGCPTCHVIPHVPGAVGKVGPSLRSLSQRSYLAGTLPNTPANLERWLMHPQSIHPGTAMPEMGIDAPDAQQMAEFLEAGP